MQPPGTSNLVLMALLPLIVWRTYARFKRMVGRQRLSPIRPWITLAIFPTLVALLAYSSRAHRLVEIYVIDSPGSRDATDFVQSSLTLMAFGLLAGNFIAYAVSLARWRWRVLRAKRLREAAQAAAAEETAGAP